MKKISIPIIATAAVAAFFLLMNPVSVGTEDITTVCVVDYDEIERNFYKETEAYRNIQKIIDERDNAIQEIREEIDDLEQDKVSAIENNNSLRVRQIESDILEKQYTLKEVKRTYDNRVESAKKLFPDDFLTELYDAIDYVASAEGYTVAINENDQSVFWYSPSVNITAQVIDYLLKKR
ncbi:MAG: OmpH family outer membrane protein [Spirochaetia bacterium]